MSLSRRAFIGSSLGAAIANPPFGSAASASEQFRISAPGPGTAAAILLPLIKEHFAQTKEPQDFQWVGGNPGQPQTQLLANALDVGGFGPLGLAQARSKGYDIVIFGPVLNNHGRWIVRGNSSFRTPHDLIGKRIATQPETSETFKQAALAAAAAGIDLKRQTQLFFGPPIVNFALFERGDVDALIELEPVATRLVAKGARQISTVQEMWQTAGGGDLFLAGLAAHRSWLTQNSVRASRLARLYLNLDRRLQREPELFRKYHDELNIPASETHGVDLLVERMPSVFATQWDEQILAGIDKQLQAAARLGLAPPAKAADLCDLTALGTS